MISNVNPVMIKGMYKNEKQFTCVELECGIDRWMHVSCILGMLTIIFQTRTIFHSRDEKLLRKKFMYIECEIIWLTW